SVGVSVSENLSAAPTIAITGSCISTSNPSVSPIGQATAYTATYAVPAGNTNCTATVNASGNDLAGNPGSATATFSIDRVAPTITLSAAPSTANAFTFVSIVASANETLAAAPVVSLSGTCITATTVNMSPSGQDTSYSG